MVLITDPQRVQWWISWAFRKNWPRQVDPRSTWSIDFYIDSICRKRSREVLRKYCGSDRNWIYEIPGKLQLLPGCCVLATFFFKVVDRVKLVSIWCFRYNFPKQLYLRFGIGCPTQRVSTLPRSSKNAFVRAYDSWVLLWFFLGVIPKISPCESLFGGVPIKIIGWEIYDPEWWNRF